jgi:hypothetical protein
VVNKKKINYHIEIIFIIILKLLYERKNRKPSGLFERCEGYPEVLDFSIVTSTVSEVVITTTHRRRSIWKILSAVDVSAVDMSAADLSVVDVLAVDALNVDVSAVVA